MRASRRWLLAGPPGVLAVLGALALTGCGKHDLRSSVTVTQPLRHTVIAQRRPTDARVALARPLTPSVAAAFAKAVQLVPVDVAGSRPQSRGERSAREEQEAASCGSAETELGDAHSPDLVRGPGLERESISSSVVVLASEAMVRRELAYVNSHAGIACYGRILRHIIEREQSERVRLGAVRLARLQVFAPGAQVSTGISIVAQLSLSGSALSVPLFIDELSFGYGPAEIQLYATSFVQPVPAKVDEQLLTLLWQRAQLHPL